ncbi:hypothetical protein [Ornithinimicrobium flavum]|uniref:hypothetical protein n=1 Tax=Ornithinimicrobium flavum TaxID=1288636 RepID=UPI00106F4CB1|nr:hypothetical protein [Ornithinimicrobium flavum]
MPSTTGSAAAALHAADDLTALAPELGWAEATGLADALIDTLAHRLVDLAAGRHEPTTLPAVVGAIGGTDGEPDHASCRAAAARLRALAPLVRQQDGLGWAAPTADVMTSLADLLDQVAERSRRRPLTLTDKGVVLRRLHGLHRQLR